MVESNRRVIGDDGLTLSSDFSKRQLFYVVDWLPPDFGAVGQYATIFARQMAQSGRKVCLIGLTTGEHEESREIFATGGVLEVKRLAARRYDKSRLLGRLIWSLRTNFALIWKVIGNTKSRGADVLFTGSPPFMLYFAIFAKWLRRARLVYRITDFYPEVLIAALGRKNLPLALLERMTWLLRKQVDVIQILGEDQRRLILAGGIAPERIILKRDVPPTCLSARDPVAPPSALLGRKVLLYSGNYGVAHEVDTVLEGLIRHNRDGSGRFGFWLNASGSRVESIVKGLRAAGVPFAHTAPVPLDDLPGLLAAADVHLITLRNPFVGLVLPSKIYGCIQSGRAILFVGPRNSDVHALCMESKSLTYRQVDPGDISAFADALDWFSYVASRAAGPAEKVPINHD